MLDKYHVTYKIGNVTEIGSVLVPHPSKTEDAYSAAAMKYGAKRVNISVAKVGTVGK